MASVTVNGRLFPPGQSGNPKGRPKDVGIVRDLARLHTEECIRTLAEIMGNPEAKDLVRVAAANSLLDRGWGKAMAMLEVTQAPTKIEQMTTSQLQALVQQHAQAAHDQPAHSHAIDAEITELVEE